MCLEAAGDAFFVEAKKTALLFLAAAVPVVQEHTVLLRMRWCWFLWSCLNNPMGCGTIHRIVYKCAGVPVLLEAKGWTVWTDLTQGTFAEGLSPFWRSLFISPVLPDNPRCKRAQELLTKGLHALICSLLTTFQLFYAQSPSLADLSFVYIFGYSPVCDWGRGQRQRQLLSVGFGQCVVHTEPQP